MKKLKRVRLINWHNLVNEVIEINGNTILTGPNASGKSTILDAITFVLTAGDVSFNIAANEKSKRDLKGYIKCKLGIDDKEYQRPGDVSGHIALEFYDERAEKYFTVGAACDAFGETTPVKTLFYKNEAQFEDSWFLDDRKKVYGTVEFRKHNPSFEYYLTKKEAKRGFRNAFGSINEDFYKLIPKALAFKPIADVKDFIYENILEEKQIDVSAIQDSIRAYKELEVTLKQIQAKIADLREIDVLYQEIVKIRENKAYLEYLMHLFNVEAIKKQIKDFKKKIDTENEYKASKNLELKDLENENLQLNERSKELYKMLDSNEAFKMDEYLNREINRIQTDNKSLEENQAAFLRRAASFKDILADLKRLSNEKIYNEGTNINLSLINQQSVLDAKLRLNDFSARINEVKDKKNQELGQIQSKINEIVLSINKIQNAVNNANQNKRNYNPQILQIKEELQENLKLLYNYDISVHILCELCEITDPKWADTVEVFLGNRRFMLVVEPRYYDQALNIYARIVNKYRLYGIGLINTKKIQNFKNYEKNSLASIIETENQDVRYYINYVCGSVIMVDNPQDLEKYNTAITNNYIIYRGFTVTQLNSNIDKPFIGASAIMKSQEDLKKQAAQIKDEYYEVKTKKEALEKEVELINSINIKPILDDLDKALALEKNKASLEDLKKKAKATRNMTPTELEDDYRKIDETINNNNDKKNQILLEIGSINQRIEALNQNIKENTVELETLTNELNKMAENNTVIAERANNEFNEMTSLQGFKNAINQYQERYKTEENSYNSLADAITAKQYAYINNYNSNLSIGINEVEKFLIELNKLEKSELITYEKKVREAREAAEVVFKEDFIAKLRNNILTAEQEIQKINETLSTIKFGQDSYEFIFPKNQEFSAFYDMVTSDLADYNQGLFTFEFQEKYDKEIKELFDSLSVTPLNSNGALNRFTDYRTYMGYDIRITNANGETMTYSKVFKEKSGGETQVPFYVAIVASFVRLYTKNTNIGGDPIGLIMFDEVFDKMDGNRMKAMMSFITSMPLQVIIACPPQRMDILRSYVDTTLIMVRQGNLAHVLPVNRKA